MMTIVTNSAFLDFFLKYFDIYEKLVNKDV